MGFSRQEYWSGLPFPSLRIFLTQGSNPHLLHLLRWPMDSFTTAPWLVVNNLIYIFKIFLIPILLIVTSYFMSRNGMAELYSLFFLCHLMLESVTLISRFAITYTCLPVLCHQHFSEGLKIINFIPVYNFRHIFTKCNNISQFICKLILMQWVKVVNLDLSLNQRHSHGVTSWVKYQNWKGKSENPWCGEGVVDTPRE